MNHNLMDSLPEPIRKAIYVVDLGTEDFKTIDFSKAQHKAMFARTAKFGVEIKQIYVPVSQWEALRDIELEDFRKDEF